MEYFLENSDFVVRINSLGAEVKSVLNKKTYREYMWYGDSKFWGRTSPVLFPFVGSLKDKKYIFEGTEYPMGQHGFARDMEFDFLSRDKDTHSPNQDTISFILKSDENTLKKYPFEFELIITYTLIENELKVVWTVNNPSEQKMYFSIGAHPAFLVPIHGENSKEGYKLYFEACDVIHHHGNTADTGLAIMDEDITLPLSGGLVNITLDFFDRCTYMIEGNQTKLVGIEDPSGNRFIEVKFDTPLFAIWSPEQKNAPFLCIEPWYGRCDATDFEGDLTKRDYTNTLNPGESFVGGYSMKFFPLRNMG